MTGMDRKILLCASGLLLLSGCATRPAAQPGDFPLLYSPAYAASADDPCLAMAEEVREIDDRLGESAVEAPVPAPATVGQRVRDYGRNLAVETVLGFVQPVVQTVLAVTDSEGKAVRAALARERGLVRRAYLLGAMEGRGCEMPAFKVPDNVAGAALEEAPAEPESDVSEGEPAFGRPRRGPGRSGG